MADKPLDIFDDYSESEAESHNDNPYPRSVKFGVVLLSALAVVLVFWQMKRNLVLEMPTFGNGTSSERSIGILQQEDDQLRNQDSDLDGLTDYDELKVYGTSPFIADTDSDGKSDAEEVADGTDPNCPIGKNCFGIVAGISDTIASDNFLESPELQSILSDPNAIRDLLVQGGLDRDAVNQLDDQSLQILAQETLKQIQEPTPEKISNLQKLPPDEIRTLMIQFGFSQEELDQITDEDLQEVFVESLEKIKEEQL